MVHIVQFSEERIELQKEIREHPELLTWLNNHEQDEFETLLAEVALFCGVLVHGDYTEVELDKLCGILVDKLREKRRAIITTSRGLKL